MRDDRDQGAVDIAVTHTDHEGGAHLALHAEIESHTSPRFGAMFLSFKVAKELIGSQGRFPIVQRPGIERRRAAQELHGENPLFLFWQSFEGFQELGSLLAQATLFTYGRQVHRDTANQDAGCGVPPPGCPCGSR